MIVACLLGVAIPAVLRAAKADPRIAAGPVVLAAADVVTLLLYFGLGARCSASLGESRDKRRESAARNSSADTRRHFPGCSVPSSSPPNCTRRSAVTGWPTASSSRRISRFLPSVSVT